MKIILDILTHAGGYRPDLYLRIENPPYMALVIEATPDAGPLGQPGLSVAHYGELNGDLMRDPEMCFEFTTPLGGKLELDPYLWRNDYVAIEQWSRSIHQGFYLARPELYLQHKQFAALWDRNLREQRFLEAFSDNSIRG